MGFGFDRLVLAEISPAVTAMRQIPRVAKLSAGRSASHRGRLPHAQASGRNAALERQVAVDEQRPPSNSGG